MFYFLKNFIFQRDSIYNSANRKSQMLSYLWKFQKVMRVYLFPILPAAFYFQILAAYF